MDFCPSAAAFCCFCFWSLPFGLVVSIRVATSPAKDRPGSVSQNPN